MERGLNIRGQNSHDHQNRDGRNAVFTRMSHKVKKTL